MRMETAMKMTITPKKTIAMTKTMTLAVTKTMTLIYIPYSLLIASDSVGFWQ